jgi:hypothetical protein
MAMFRVTTKDNTCNQIFVQGARAHNNSNDIAAVIFQNYDADTSNIYNMASIAMIDEFGNTACNGMGCLILKTNVDGSNLTEKVRIDNMGNLLVGTIYPEAKLTVSGGIKANLATLGSTITSNVALTFSSNPATSNNNIIMFADQSDGKLKAIKPNNSVVVLEAPAQSISSNMFVSDTNLSLTTSSTFTNKLVLTTPELSAGMYRVDTSYEVYNGDLYTSTIRVRSWINDSNNGVWFDNTLTCPTYDNKSTIVSYSDFTLFDSKTSSNITIALQYASPTGTMVGIQKAKINIFQINTYDSYYSETTLLTLTTSVTLRDKLELVTPIIDVGTYRLDVAFQLISCNNNLVSSPIRIVGLINGLEWFDEVVNCPFSSTNTYANFNILSQTTYSSVAVKVQFSSPSGALVGIQNTKLHLVKMI